MARKAQAQSWYFFSSGTRGIAYAFAFAGGGRAQTETYIDRDDATWNKWLFDELHAQREQIEAEFGEPLSWERLDARRASRIAVKRPGRIDDPPEILEEIEDWAVDRLLRFKRVIGSRAAALAMGGAPPSSPADFQDVL